MLDTGFFALLARMKHIMRWGLMRNSLSENLSEHSYDTAVTAHALAVIGNTYFSRNLDPCKIAAAALFHDASEIITGDMPTPVKYHSNEIKTAYKAVEQAACDKLCSALPEKMRPHYRVLLSFEQDEPELYRYVKAADKISAYIKCMTELKSGNSEFSSALLQTRDAIGRLGLPEADYYMKHFAPAFELTLDELSKE